MQKNGPDIAVFPPAVSVAVPLAALALEWLLPLRVLPAAGTPAILWPGVCLSLAAGALAVSGTRAFKRAGTNVDPRQPALQFVQSGPYRFTRNPMYLGMVILQLGLALLFSLDWALAGAVVVWTVLHWGVVLREERYLVGLFGEAYTSHLSQTRRWL